MLTSTQSTSSSSEKDRSLSSLTRYGTVSQVSTRAFFRVFQKASVTPGSSLSLHSTTVALPVSCMPPSKLVNLVVRVLSDGKSAHSVWRRAAPKMVWRGVERLAARCTLTLRYPLTLRCDALQQMQTRQVLQGHFLSFIQPCKLITSAALTFSV